MTGGRFVLAAAYVFLGPLAVLIAAVALLGDSLGELAAFGIGILASVVLLLPAWWHLRRR